MSLWTTPASPQPAFLDLPDLTPQELEKIAREVAEDPEFQEELRRRLAPYQTRDLTAEELFRPIY